MAILDYSKFKLIMPAKSKLLLHLHNKKSQKKIPKRTLNPEFTTAIRAAKLIRVCAALMKPDRSRFHRLAKFILHHVIHADTFHKTGERQILIENLKVFEGYEFDPDHQVSNYIPAGIITGIENKITLTIPCAGIRWPVHTAYCKITLLGVGIDLASHTSTSVSGSTAWIARSDLQAGPVYIEINNDQPLFVAIGVAYTNDKASAITCQAVKIIDVNIGNKERILRPENK